MDESRLIIGDAGGTGTQWRVVSGANILQLESSGFNAYIHSIKDFQKEVKTVFKEHITSVSKVYLYAAGVDTAKQKEEVEAALQEVFNASVVVENDLLGVARSLCGREPGNVCILGTGANACYYDGSGVNKVSASLGYVLGDEGSGAYIGKKLLKGIFRNRFSNEITEAFHDTYKVTSYDVIQAINHGEAPNHYLGSFAKFAHEWRNHPEVYPMLVEAFEDFFNAFLYQPSSKSHSCYFSGSIAWHFADILREVASNTGHYIKHISQSPISGLLIYHQKYG